jgi:hypothetical protein
MSFLCCALLFIQSFPSLLKKFAQVEVLHFPHLFGWYTVLATLDFGELEAFSYK